MIKYNVESEKEFEYLQVNLFTDLLDKLIEEAKSLPKDIPSFKRVAALRVFKKTFYDLRHIGSETKSFSHPSQVLNYSWKLFKEKINQGNLFFSDPENPRVKFNISKYYQFQYGTELCEVDTTKKHEIEDIM